MYYACYDFKLCKNKSVRYNYKFLEIIRAQPQSLQTYINNNDRISY